MWYKTNSRDHHTVYFKQVSYLRTFFFSLNDMEDLLPKPAWVLQYLRKLLYILLNIKIPRLEIADTFLLTGGIWEVSDHLKLQLLLYRRLDFSLETVSLLFIKWQETWVNVPKGILESSPCPNPFKPSPNHSPALTYWQSIHFLEPSQLLSSDTTAWKLSTQVKGWEHDGRMHITQLQLPLLGSELT